METVGIRAFCEAVYCTLTRWEAFVLDDEQCIRFTALNGVRVYRLEFLGVHDFWWQEEHEPPQDRAPTRRSPDDRLELSDVELEREADGWRFWCNPWYSRTIEFRCTAIRLNGLAVAGTGKWLQNELPTVAPDIPAYTEESVDNIDAILDIPRAG